MGLPNTILLSAISLQVMIREALAVEAFTPGALLERVPAGFQLNSGQAVKGQCIIALENIADAGGIDRDYVAGETARVAFPKSGDMVNCILAPGADAILAGGPLESNGDGTVRAATDVAATVGYAYESIDNSAGATTARIQMEVL